MIDPGQHWEAIYQTKGPAEVSWYQPHLAVSLELIEATAGGSDAAIIDVGAGESTLVDDLLQRGYRSLHALDLSPTALEVAKARAGVGADRIQWLCGDVRSFPLARHRFDVWHDRAVFHFLIDASDRSAYVRQVRRAVKPGGHVIVATFGPEGPAKCSGLDVVRYDPAALHQQFGAAFRLLAHRTELHRTPSGATQQFTYCCCRVVDSPV